jgi:hypothetical protein
MESAPSNVVEYGAHSKGVTTMKVAGAADHSGSKRAPVIGSGNDVAVGGEAYDPMSNTTLIPLVRIDRSRGVG